MWQENYALLLMWTSDDVTFLPALHPPKPSLMILIQHLPSSVLRLRFINKLAKTLIPTGLRLSGEHMAAGVPEPVTSGHKQPNLFIPMQYKKIVF